MKRIKTLTNRTMKNTMVKGGCGECQTSCQSACKTSCTVGNQSCENAENKYEIIVDRQPQRGPSNKWQSSFVACQKN